MKNYGVSIALILLLLTSNANGAQGIAERGDAHLTMTLSGPETVRSGDKIEIGLTLTNSTQFVIPTAVQFSPQHAELTRGFIVLGPNGLKPPNTAYGHDSDKDIESFIMSDTLGAPPPQLTRSIKTVTMKPGDIFHESSVLSDIYNMSAPGKYTIQAEDQLSDGSVVKSNKIMVTVTK